MCYHLKRFSFVPLINKFSNGIYNTFFPVRFSLRNTVGCSTHAFINIVLMLRVYRKERELFVHIVKAAFLYTTRYWYTTFKINVNGTVSGKTCKCDECFIQSALFIVIGILPAEIYYDEITVRHSSLNCINAVGLLELSLLSGRKITWKRNITAGNKNKFGD